MLYAVNSQQMVNLLQIQIIDDFGYDLKLTMPNGREFTVHGSKRQEFFTALAIATGA